MTDPFADDVLRVLAASNQLYQRGHGQYIAPLAERLLVARAHLLVTQGELDEAREALAIAGIENDSQISHDHKIDTLRNCADTVAYALLELGIDEHEVREWFGTAVNRASLDYASDTMEAP